MYLDKTPKKTHAATTLLVFRIHILDRIKFMSPGPSLTLPPQILLIAHCGPLVAPLNGARSLRWAITVGKQPVKYGRLQTHYERSRAFLETCTQFSIQSWNPFTVLVAFLCVFLFSPPHVCSNIMVLENIYLSICSLHFRHFYRHIPQYSALFMCIVAIVLLCPLQDNQQWLWLSTFLYFFQVNIIPAI